MLALSHGKAFLVCVVTATTCMSTRSQFPAAASFLPKRERDAASRTTRRVSFGLLPLGCEKRRRRRPERIGQDMVLRLKRWSNGSVVKLRHPSKKGGAGQGQGQEQGKVLDG